MAKYKYTPEKLKVKIDEYFKYCDENEKPYLNSSLALYLDIDRDTLLNYEKQARFSALIKKTKERIKCYAEEFLFTSNKTAAAIFNLKCNYSWKDVQDINITGNIDVKFNEE